MLPETISKYPLIWLIEDKDKEDSIRETISRRAISYTSNAPYVALTVASLSADDVITLQTNNATTGLNAIEVDDILYKSAKETVTVTA